MSAALLSSDVEAEVRDERHQPDSLAAGLSFMLVANLLQRGIGFARSILLCRILVDEHLGMWALASSFFVLAAPLAVLGLPGTFGRLVESYRVSGHLHVYLRRVAIVSSIGVAACVAGLIAIPDASSRVIFGTSLSLATMSLVAAVLCAVILFNTLTELLSGLRKPKVVSAMHTTQSLVFTLTSLSGLVLINDWRVLIAAFGVSSMAGVIPAIPSLRFWNEQPMRDSAPAQLSAGEMWNRVIPFALSMWCMNLLSNLFEVVDRYMLLYLSADSAMHGQALVGQFHSGRIMPVLLTSLTMMLGGLLLPYLAADWERGNRKAVSDSLRLTLKCSTLFFFVLSLGSLAVAPVLFEHVLAGRYADGLAILPLALVHCSFAGVAYLMQNYFWCAERGRVVSIHTALGLILNILLNVFWVPLWGLHGAMLATAVSGAFIWLMTLVSIKWAGVQIGLPCYAFGVLPVVLALGTVPSALVLTMVLIVSSRTHWFFSPTEKDTLDRAILPKIQRLGFGLPSLWPPSAR
jgi:O-antigen/teichoic acid export membrane protein